MSSRKRYKNIKKGIFLTIQQRSKKMYAIHVRIWKSGSLIKGVVDEKNSLFVGKVTFGKGLKLKPISGEKEKGALPLQQLIQFAKAQRGWTPCTVEGESARDGSRGFVARLR
jgi:hypothetical protein